MLVFVYTCARLFPQGSSVTGTCLHKSSVGNAFLQGAQYVPLPVRRLSSANGAKQPIYFSPIFTNNDFFEIGSFYIVVLPCPVYLIIYLI